MRGVRNQNFLLERTDGSSEKLWANNIFSPLIKLIKNLDTIKFLDRRMQMVTTSMNKCGSELQQKAMAGQAIEKEMESKMKEMNLYNKIYQ